MRHCTQNMIKDGAFAAIIVAVVLLFACAIIGCTVIPKTVKSDTASYDGNLKNSGVLRIIPKGPVIVTSAYVARYNELIGTYGKRFIPALKPSDGVSAMGTAYAMDREHFVDSEVMNSWAKSAR